MDSEEDCPDEWLPSFEGPCTCDHDGDDHGWMNCNIDGCTCEACWVE